MTGKCFACARMDVDRAPERSFDHSSASRNILGGFEHRSGSPTIPRRHGRQTQWFYNHSSASPADEMVLRPFLGVIGGRRPKIRCVVSKERGLAGAPSPWARTWSARRSKHARRHTKLKIEDTESAHPVRFVSWASEGKAHALRSRA